ncbi:MAG: bifunctional protein-serine/threonine kinase/phosphatase [Colwellia sp.]
MSVSVTQKNSVTPNKPASLQLCFGGYSCAGVKAENQDAFAAYLPTPKNATTNYPSHELVTKGAIAVIADGVSSANKAAEASQISVTQFISDYYATPETWSTRKSAAKVITSLNQWLYSQGSSIDSGNNYISQEQQQWLTTFSALVLKSTTGYIFHVGDTRISKYRQQQMEAITQDHNCKQGSKSVVLTRALGADSRLQVDVHQVGLQKDDIYLLTCDGVHEFLSTKALKTLLNEISDSPDNQELEKISRKIVDQALAAGSDDNVSCLLVYVTDTPSRKLDEIERDLCNKAIPPALEVGQRIDDYQVKKVIHASIRSHLYLVTKPNSTDLAVLKTPSTNFSDDAIYLQGFIREAWLGEHVKHNNIMAIEKTQAKSKFLYHVCEHIEGQTLREWMYDNPKPTIAQVRDIIGQIISALRVFQRLDIVHRDLKPDNVMIDKYEQIKLIDYGTVSVASLDENQNTLKGSVPQGSLNYIAPETLLTMKTNYLSDLFSLGVIGYELLTGELPYKPMTRAEVNFNDYKQWHYRNIKQCRDELPVWLDLTLQQATSANPKNRYQAFSEFYSDLNKPNTSVIEEYKNQPLLQRNPVLFWQGVSSVLFITLLAVLFYR